MIENKMTKITKNIFFLILSNVFKIYTKIEGQN